MIFVFENPVDINFFKNKNKKIKSLTNNNSETKNEDRVIYR